MGINLAGSNSDSFNNLADAAGLDADRPSSRLEHVMQYLNDCPHANDPVVMSGPKHVCPCFYFTPGSLQDRVTITVTYYFQDIVMFLANEKRVGLMIDALQVRYRIELGTV